MKDQIYKNILMNSSIGYAYHQIILDDDGVPCNYKFLEVNQAFEQFTGLKADDVIGKTVLDAIPNITLDEVDWIAHYGDIALHNTQSVFEGYSKSLKSWYKVEAYSPEKYFFVTIFTNITKTKKQQENYIELENVFSNVIKQAPIAIMVHADDGEVLNVSNTWEDMTGYAHKDIPTIFEWTKKAYGEGQVEVVDFINQLYKLKKRQHDGEFLIQTNDQRQLIWDFYSMYIGDAEDGRKMAMSVAIDVTEDRKNKNDLMAQRLLLETTLLSVGDGVITTDINGNITLINSVAEHLTGWQKQDAVGKPIEEVFVIFNEYSKIVCDSIIETVISTGIVHELANHTVLRSKDGTERPIADSAAPIKLSTGEIIGAVLVFRDYTEKYNTQKEIEQLIEELQQTQVLLQASLNSPKDIIILSLDKEYRYLYFNEAHRISMKESYDADVVKGGCIFDYMTKEDDILRIKKNYDIALSGKSYITTEQYGDYDINVFETIFNPIVNQNKEIIGVSAFARDISDRIQATSQIRESEEKYRLLYSSMNQGLALHEIIVDGHGKPVDYIYLDINDSYTELFGITREMCIGKRITEVMPLVEPYWIQTFGKVALTGEPIYYENYLETTQRHYSTYTYCPSLGQFAVLVSDITDRIEREAKIEYLSYHDYLTGLYNRRFYEEELLRLDTEENLPLSLIMGDVNGLKLVNDSFGHETGDELLVKVSKILQDACRSNDIITRIGGDEFVIILPKTNEKIVQKIIERIKIHEQSEKVESLDISISFGFGTKTSTNQNIRDIFKNIEDAMYSQKLTESRSARSKTIDLIMRTLYEKNNREMNHSLRVGNLCEQLAKKLHFSTDKIKQIKTAGLMHDIGKIGINEEILNKPSALTEEEWAEIKRHSEVGYRILSSVNEFNDIANYILEHHEKWDGSGYPNGLKGEEITFEARIVNIADAYDAMTGYRTYREILTKEQAIAEIKKSAGIQFDPEISKVFVEKVLKEQW